MKKNKSYFRKVTLKDIIKMIKYPIKEIFGVRFIETKKKYAK